MGTVYKRGNHWYIGYASQGKYVRKSTRFPTKEMAKIKLNQIELAIAKGELGILEDKKLRFRDFAQEYLEHKQKRGKRAWVRDEIIVRKHLIPIFGDTFLSKITHEMVDRYMDSRLEKVKPGTVGKERDVLRHILNLAIRWGHLRKNPAAGYRHLEIPPGRIRFLDEDEIPRLLAACNPNLRPIVVCALNTGMRRGEILGLQWEDVDLKRRLITLNRTKTNERRVIPINDVLLEELQKIPGQGQGGYVFLSGRQDRYTNIHKVFRGAVERAKIKDFRFHDLRHTFASHLVMRGVSLKAVADLLGHKDIKMTLRYAHLSPDHLAGAVDRLCSIFTQSEFSKILPSVSDEK